MRIEMQQYAYSSKISPTDSKKAIVERIRMSEKKFWAQNETVKFCALQEKQITAEEYGRWTYVNHIKLSTICSQVFLVAIDNIQNTLLFQHHPTTHYDIIA